MYFSPTFVLIIVAWRQCLWLQSKMDPSMPVQERGSYWWWCKILLHHHDIWYLQQLLCPAMPSAESGSSTSEMWSLLLSWWQSCNTHYLILTKHGSYYWTRVAQALHFWQMKMKRNHKASVEWHTIYSVVHSGKCVKGSVYCLKSSGLTSSSINGGWYWKRAENGFCSPFSSRSSRLGSWEHFKLEINYLLSSANLRKVGKQGFALDMLKGTFLSLIKWWWLITCPWPFWSFFWLEVFSMGGR